MVDLLRYSFNIAVLSSAVQRLSDTKNLQFCTFWILQDSEGKTSCCSFATGLATARPSCLREPHPILPQPTKFILLDEAISDPLRGLGCSGISHVESSEGLPQKWSDGQAQCLQPH